MARAIRSASAVVRASQATSTFRSGTALAPYVRKTDGVRTLKVGFTCTEDLADDLRQYVATLSPKRWTRNTWLEAVIAKAIAEEFGK